MIDNNIPLTDEEKEKDSFSTSFLYDDISINTSQPEVTSKQTPSSTSFLYDDTPSSPLVNRQIDEVPTSSLYDDTVYSSQPSNKYSQTEWEAQPEFQRTWNRFANSIGEDDDFYEFMRDADWNLGSAAFRAIESGKWNDQQKQDYLYLKNVYDNTDLEGFGEWLQFTKNASWDLITDPANALALLFAIPTLGTSTAIRAAAGEASKQALKKYILANIGEATLSSATKKAAIIEGMKRPAIYGAAEGAVWTGAYDYLSQSTDMNVNPLKTDIDWTQIGISSGLGGTIGGTIGTLVGGVSGARFLQKEFDYFNEAAILEQSNKTSKASRKAELDAEDAIDDLSKAPKQKLSERFIASTVGKTTTAFLNLTEASPTLEKYLSYIRYDYDFSLFGKKRPGEKAESFGLKNSRRQGNYLFRLERSLNDLKRTGFLAALTKKENDQLYEVLLNPRIKKFNGEAITPEVRKAAKEVRPILNDLFTEGKRVGVFTEFQQVLNYVPRRFKWDLVEKGRHKLEQIIINHGLADPITEREIKKGVTASGKEIDVVLLDQKTVDEDAFGDIAKTWLQVYKDGDIKLAQKMKAEAIVTNMLETRWTPFELKTKGNVGDSYGFMKHRPFHAIPDEELRPFLENNLEKVLQDYIINASNAITRSEFFGRNLQAFNDNFLQPIRKELMDGNMSANDTQKVLDKITNMHNKITGIDSQVIKNKTIRTSVEGLKLMQQMAHLPLATLSSITEPILMMARLDAKDMPYAVGQIAKALTKETVKTIDKTIKGFRRGVLRQEVKGKGNDLTDAEWQELYETGLALEQSVMERIEGMYGEAFQNTATRGMQNFFFKSNLLTQWTSAVQLASFNVGKRLIQSNAKKLLDNQTGKKVINRKTQQYYEEQLEDLGLNVNKTLAWYKRSLKNNEFDRNRSNIQNFYKEDIQNAANRFTKEVILNPSTSEANRPLWFSNPSVNFLVQFAGYPTVFNNTIMKRFVNETRNYPTKVAPKILATSMLMTSVALLGNYIRTVGISGNQERWDNQSDGLKIFDAFRRWGGMAFMDYAVRAETEVERGTGIPISVVKGVVGPIGQDAVDMALYRKGFAGLAVDNLPYSAWLPSDVKKKLKTEARKIDKSMGENIPDIFPDEPEQSKKSKSTRRTPYRKGLEVNIPNAVREPEKAKIRNMNMTYAELGGILAQDPEDRKGFGVGGISKALTKVITKGSAFKTTKPEKITLYHGAGKDFDQFDINYATEGSLGRGLYFSDSPLAIEQYVKRDVKRVGDKSTPTNYEVEVNLNNDELLQSSKSISEHSKITQDKINKLVKELNLTDEDEFGFLTYTFNTIKDKKAITLWRILRENYGDEEATRILKKYGIKGMKAELSPSLSRVTGNLDIDQTHYSIFDDTIINIRNKYDEGGRVGFAEGEEVKYGRASNWLWNALLHGSPYGQMKMWSKILGEADLKKRPRINTVKSKLDEAVSWMDDSFVDPVKEVTSTEWGKKREEARRQEALDQSNVPINDTDEDETSGWFGIGRKGRQARRAQRRAERRGERDLETYAEKLAREARDAQRGAEQTQRIQSQSRHRGDAMFKREVEALTGTDSGTEGSRGTRRVMFNEGSLVNVLENLQTAFDTLSAREKIEVAGLLNQKRKSFADGSTVNVEYRKKLQDLEDFISKNRLVSKEAQMSLLSGEGYRDPRFIATTGNELVDKYGLHPFAAEGSGRILNTKELGIEGSAKLFNPQISGTYATDTDKIMYKDIRNFNYKVDPENQPEFTQVHEIIHRADKRSGYKDQRAQRLRAKLPEELKGYSHILFSTLTQEILAHGLQHKLAGGNFSDEELIDHVKFRINEWMPEKFKNSKKVEEELLRAMPIIVDDFETYLIELEAN